MNKICFFLMLMVSVLLTSCNDEITESTIVDHHGTERQVYAFAYKMDTETSVSTRTTSLNTKTWNAGETIRIKFLNGNTMAQNKVKEVAAEWLDYANLKFEYVGSSEDADVKIAFSWNNEYVTWSTIGTDCKRISKNEPSMNLTLFGQSDSKEINSEEFKIAILREFGHALGLIYENQGPESSFKWDATRVKNYFRAQGWSQSQIDNLLHIYSTAETNYTEFDSESIMLLFFPDFLTTDNKGSKYNTKLSEKDKEFMESIYPQSTELPDKIKLTYKQTNDPNSYEYTAVRIGEYYWIDNNFYHTVPNPGWGLFEQGGESDITSDMLDTYMKGIHLDLNKKNNSNYPNFPNQIYNLDNFNRYYGRYYNRKSIDYMTNNGKMYQGSKVSSNWELPSYVDYRQLFAMCPFFTTEGILTRYDIQVALAAKHGDNPATSPYYTEFHSELIHGENSTFNGKCVNPDGRFGIHAVYFNTQTDGLAQNNTNMYGFNMMAGGARGNNTGAWVNGLYDITTGNSYHDGADQYMYHLFYTAGFYTKESNVYVHDYIDTYNSYSYHWYNARWCRRLTDAELGYKLYINSEQTDIKKLDLTETPPTEYSELPKGYLRGFYVQYILDNPSPKYTVSDLVRFANKVDDRTK